METIRKEIWDIIRNFFGRGWRIILCLYLLTTTYYPTTVPLPYSLPITSTDAVTYLLSAAFERCCFVWVLCNYLKTDKISLSLHSLRIKVVFD
ncbi:hypothetical protein QBC43DRAFT_57836 [Cladorrhinum sp. PSN259]|nr:hypothetical protein QBC43DRAFT_57836 [Cladorrhinum sp. PSN259]